VAADVPYPIVAGAALEADRQALDRREQELDAREQRIAQRERQIEQLHAAAESRLSQILNRVRG
jgi:hypothetical protein